MEAKQPSYLIVGAGIFGASTALHLKAAEPKAQVTLIDRAPYPCPYGASFDLNKIIRDYYTDKFYMRLANEAQQEWRNGEEWKPFYHETGLFVADDTGLGRKIIQNYQDLHMDHSSEMISPAEVGRRWDGVYRDVHLDGVKEIFWNAGCGWADASGALQYTIKAAIESGVTYKEGEMASLLLDDCQSCYGVRLTDESKLIADHVVLCTGAHTAKLLADSAPQWEELQVNDRVLATGVVAAYVRLNSHQMERFKAMPVYVGAMPDVKGKRKAVS
jgi:sarcosine oxidase/L-pipecolate oxidase